MDGHEQDRTVNPAETQPQRTMTAEPRHGKNFVKTIGVVGGIITALIAVGGAAKAWVILPYRIDQHETDIKSIRQEYRDVSAEQRAQREILIRIEERLKTSNRN